MPPEQLSITWVGHATVLVEVGATRIVTDPAVTGRLAHLRRRVPTPVLPDIDVVAISHLHLDHLHGPSLRRVRGTGRVVVPLGAAPLVASLPGRATTEVVAGDVVEVAAGVRLRAVPANHSSSRGPQSRVRAAPVGYVIEAAGRRVYFAGDTDLFDEMHQLADQGRIDVALLPIWGWGPTLGDRHLDPPRAATATTWIDPVTVVPIHWGTYSPMRARPGSPPWLDRPIDAFRAALDEHGRSDRLQVLRPGESLTLAPVG